MACKNVFTSLSLNFGNNQREVSKGQGARLIWDKLSLAFPKKKK